MTKRFVLSARCGTCDHQHPMGGCDECQLAGLDCLGWTAHSDDISEAEDRELRELVALDGKNLISVYESGGVCNALTAFEAEIYAELGARHDPVLATIQLGPSHKYFSGDERNIRLNRLQMDSAVWQGHTGNPLDLLADIAKEWHLLDQALNPERPAVAWALVSNGQAREAADPEGRVLDIHIATGADIDGRSYTVIRVVESGEVTRSIIVVPGWACLMSGGMDDMDHEEAAQRLDDDKLNDGHIATLQLMLVTRMEVENSLASP